MQDNMDQLNDRVNKSKKALRSRQRKMYKLAKELGFSPGQAAILQNWSEERIRNLARASAENEKS